MSKTILVTGGRSPATLALVRLLAGAGHRVLVAESLSAHLCGASRAVAKTFAVPAPNRDPEGFADALAAIVRDERVDLLLPTCEEVFWVARALPQLAAACEVFTPGLEQLRMLHSKWAFIERCYELGFAVPATWQVETPAALEALREGPAGGMKLVLKPVYSRFAARVTVLEPDAATPELPIHPEAPWVAQAFIAGRQLCTYSVVREGRLMAHAAYAANFTAGLGACIDFTAIDHPALHGWVESFASAHGFTGQLAFDLIEAADGTLYPLECNPRVTSGVTLFAPEDRLDRAFFGEATATVTPRPGAAAMMALPMWVYGLASVQSPGRFGHWLTTVVSTPDAVFQWKDPMPFFQQLPVMGDFLAKARRHGVSLLEASTIDIEWNGEP